MVVPGTSPILVPFLSFSCRFRENNKFGDVNVVSGTQCTTGKKRKGRVHSFCQYQSSLGLIYIDTKAKATSLPDGFIENII